MLCFIALQVAEVINEELPETVDAVRLSGIEFSDAMEEIGQLRYVFVCVCAYVCVRAAEVRKWRLTISLQCHFFNIRFNTNGYTQ